MKHRLLYSLAIVGTFLALCVPAKQTVFAADTINTTNTAVTSDTGNPEDTVSLIALSDCKISLSQTIYSYSGKEKKPSIIVSYNSRKLKKNRDYTIAYSNNIEVGTATVTITGINDFDGVIEKNYTIFPKAPTGLSTSVEAREIIVTWNIQSNATGYILYRREAGTTAWTELENYSSSTNASYSDSDCIYGTKYEYAVRSYITTATGTLLSDYSKVAARLYRPAGVSILQLMPVSKTAFSIKWELQEGADGYDIYQKVDNKWKKVKTVAARNTNHCTIKNLTYKTAYSFAVRAYWLSSSGTKQKGALGKPCKEKLAYKTKYENGLRLYYDASGDLITDVEGIIGSQKSYSIQINRTTNTVTVYTADSKKKGCLVPVKSFLCSTGTSTPEGTYKTTDKYRWHALFHDVYGQWCTRITGNILFHSVYYIKNEDPNTLDVVEFNKLGTPASAGCIRLCSADTKWIYDNCSRRTEVTLYDSPNPGPFGYPQMFTLSINHTWDPTDPEMKYKCKENGCHQE